MTIRCPNEDCEFHEGDGLPIYVVDDDIYTKLPTFIVSTIDKFAQLPKKLESSRLFGCGVDKRPPDLVIQDELHLITGPLGTMAGLYESSMALLCEHAGRRPKVVAYGQECCESNQVTICRRIQPVPTTGDFDG